MSHTPGPWRYEKPTDDKRDNRVIRSADGKAILCDEPYYPWCPDNEADWPLIAAAPDLLAALERIRGFVGDPVVEDICDAAIAKAEGQS